jgi:hypothetical protein
MESKNRMLTNKGRIRVIHCFETMRHSNSKSKPRMETYHGHSSQLLAESLILTFIIRPGFTMTNSDQC